MKIKQLTYLDFLLLPESERLEYQEQCLCLNHFEIDCKTWTWGDVKFCQDVLSSDCTYIDILNVVQKESPKVTEKSPAHVVLNMFNSIKQSIEEITKIESESMQYQQPAKEKAAAEAVGGFERFGTFPQTLSMVGVVAPSIKEVEAYKWEVVFAAMVYKHVEAQFQKQLYKA